MTFITRACRTEVSGYAIGGTTIGFETCVSCDKRLLVGIWYIILYYIILYYIILYYIIYFGDWATGWTIWGKNRGKGKRFYQHNVQTLWGSSSPPVRWIPGLFPGGKTAGAWIWPLTPRLVPRIRTAGAILPLSSIYAFMAWTGIYRTTVITWTTQLEIQKPPPPQFCPHNADLCSIFPLTRTSIWRDSEFWIFKYFFLLAQQPPVGQGHLINEVPRSHTTTHHSL